MVLVHVLRGFAYRLRTDGTGSVHRRWGNCVGEDGPGHLQCVRVGPAILNYVGTDFRP
jgi:hypothetical protein